MNLNSGIYEGWVRHRRILPKSHQFRYNIYMLMLNLDELESKKLDNFLRGFNRTDHFGDPRESLTTSVRNLVEQKSGVKLDGPILMLTHLRRLGYVMNPVTFFYCFGEDLTQPEMIVAEIHNTPWREIHCYVLPFVDVVSNKGLYFVKEFHVSPFMPMDQEYAWHFTGPGENLVVHMENLSEGVKMFDATLVLSRQDLSPRNLRRVFWKYPLITQKVVAAIYWQALKLWVKGMKYFAHPKKTREV